MNRKRRGAIPLVLILVIACTSTGGILGFLLGDGAGKLQMLAIGAGIGLILGLIFLPNLKAIIRWWKGWWSELKK